MGIFVASLPLESLRLITVVIAISTDIGRTRGIDISYFLGVGIPLPGCNPSANRLPRLIEKINGEGSAGNKDNRLAETRGRGSNQYDFGSESIAVSDILIVSVLIHGLRGVVLQGFDRESYSGEAIREFKTGAIYVDHDGGVIDPATL